MEEILRYDPASSSLFFYSQKCIFWRQRSPGHQRVPWATRASSHGKYKRTSKFQKDLKNLILKKKRHFCYFNLCLFHLRLLRTIPRADPLTTNPISVPPTDTASRVPTLAAAAQTLVIPIQCPPAPPCLKRDMKSGNLDRNRLFMVNHLPHFRLLFQII